MYFQTRVLPIEEYEGQRHLSVLQAFLNPTKLKSYYTTWEFWDTSWHSDKIQ